MINNAHWHTHIESIWLNDEDETSCFVAVVVVITHTRWNDEVETSRFDQAQPPSHRLEEEKEEKEEEKEESLNNRWPAWWSQTHETLKCRLRIMQNEQNPSIASSSHTHTHSHREHTIDQWRFLFFLTAQWLTISRNFSLIPSSASVSSSWRRKRRERRRKRNEFI